MTVDGASFVVHVEASGRSMRAARRLEPGDTILLEEALFTGTSGGVWAQLLFDLPSESPASLDLVAHILLVRAFSFTDLVHRGPPLETWPACDTDGACVNSQAQYFMPDSRAVAALASLSRGPADPPRELICERDCLLRQRHSALKPMSVRPAPDRTPSDGKATTPARARHARHVLSAAGAEAESGVGGAAAFGRAHRLHRRSARRRASVCERPSAARCHASGAATPTGA